MEEVSIVVILKHLHYYANLKHGVILPSGEWDVPIVLKYLRYYIDVKHGPLLPSEEFYDGTVAMLNHSWFDVWKLVLETYWDTTTISWNSKFNKYNYYIDDCKKVQPVREKLYSNLHIDDFFARNGWEYSYMWGRGVFKPSRWEYGSAWKELSIVGRETTLLYYYPISPSYFEYITLFKNIVIKNKNLFNWEGIEDFPYLNVDVYHVASMEKKSLEHHDFINGQYITDSMCWGDPLVTHNWVTHKDHAKILGLTFFWYERFGMIEKFWMDCHADWWEVNNYLFYYDFAWSSLPEYWWKGIHIDYNHYAKSNYTWVASLKDAEEFIWTDEVYKAKGINTYVIEALYAKKRK